jgi:cell division protein FtsW
MEPYRRQRLFAFLDPERDPLGSGFQALQSLIAVGSGGVFGLGPGKSMQKLFFLPHPESDFIFSIVSEELGMLGALAVVAAFAVLAWRGLRAGAKAPDTFGRYLGWGLTGVLVMQALINISVTIALLPTKGIPLPFISYGGSSLVVTLCLCGFLLNVSQHG